MTDQTQTTTEREKLVAEYRARTDAALQFHKSRVDQGIQPRCGIRLQVPGSSSVVPCITVGSAQPFACFSSDSRDAELYAIAAKAASDLVEYATRTTPQPLAKADAILAAQPLASVETLIAEARAGLPDAGPEAIARHLYTYLAANPDMSNALWLIQGLKDVIGRERTEQSRIMGDFKDAAPGAAAVAARDSFLRANPHLNESDPNVRT